MAFYSKEQGIGFAAGWFLADNENCTRITAQVGGDGYGGTVKTIGDRKIVPMGSLFPSASAPTGIVYEDIDVTNGAKPASIVVSGRVFSERLDSTPEIAGIEYVTENAVTRPY